MLIFAGGIFPPSVIGHYRDKLCPLLDIFTHVISPYRFVTDGRRYTYTALSIQHPRFSIFAVAARSTTEMFEQRCHKGQNLSERHLLYAGYQLGLVVIL